MPVVPGSPPNQAPQPAYAPDLRNVDPNQVFHAVFSQEDLTFFLPDNFDELSPEEQKEVKDKLRFCGTKFRGDRSDQPTIVTRDTLDVP